MSTQTEVRRVLGLAADAPTSAVVSAIREARGTVTLAEAEELAKYETGSEFDELDPVSASAHLAAVRQLGRPPESEGEYLQALADSGYGTEAA